MTELFRWYIARMRRDAESRSAQQKLTPMTLVERDNLRVQDMIERTGKGRLDRRLQIERDLQSRGRSPIQSMLNATKLMEEQQQAMAKLLSVLDPQTELNLKELTLDKVAELVVQELERARQGERLLADSTSDLLCSLDEDLKIQEVNLEFELATKYQKLSLITSSIESLLAPTEAGLFRAHLEKCRANSAQDYGLVECAIKAAHGEMIELEWHVEYSPTAKAFFCQARNIEEKKQRERLQAEVKAMINHDLRGPVTGVRAVLDNTVSGVYGSISENGVARINQALKAVEHMLTLINQLLEAEKLQAGEMSAVKTNIKLSEVYAKCETAMSAMLSEDRILKFPENSKLAVHADPDQIVRALCNLVSNAIKFAPPKSTIEITEESKLGRSVVISVHDEGQGIPEDLKAFVFDRYKAGRGGTGLGLYIARRFTELQGGEIGFTSEPGQGTTFWIVLPVC